MKSTRGRQRRLSTVVTACSRRAGFVEAAALMPWKSIGAVIAILLVALSSTGCRKKEKIKIVTVGVAFEVECTDLTPAAENEISISCPAEATATLITKVVIGGPTTSTDIFGVKFDLVFDSTVLSFDGAFGTGAFLQEAGAEIIIQAGSSASDPDRLIVAVTRQGTSVGVGVQGTEGLVVTLVFSAIGAGNTELGFENAEAVDSSLVPLSSIGFVGPASVTVR